MSHFIFAELEFKEIYSASRRAESLANNDPRASCFYARRALELLVTWVYENANSLTLPYRDDLSALIHEPTFRSLVGQAIFQKCRAIKELGNLAVHSPRPITRQDAINAVQELFHVCYWLARTYAKGEKPDPNLTFDPNSLPPPQKEVQKQTLAQLQKLSEENRNTQQKLLEALADRANIDEELKKTRAELAEVKRANAATPDNHNYNEAETRDLFIDLFLKEAGWPLDKPEDREYEVTGMPNGQNKGFVDYVLWSKNGNPLGLVEAKRTKRDPREGQHQAKLYAECLEAKFGVRPIIFFTNGYEHYIWDDQQYPPRQVQGFYTQDELELLIQRRTSRKPLQKAEINEKIVERYYQTRAIRRVAETFEKDHMRRALLVMATGSGKTRTVIALSDLLMRCNWAKRILFLADRTALVNQAVNAFKTHLPEATPVNLVTEKDTEGRVYVSTYPTMIGLIDETKKTGQRRFGPGYFDLVIIDEAHRSVYLKYKSIFDYFDSLLVGLTATPRDEIDRDTYGLFELEKGVPTDAYDLGDAIDDGFLVPPESVSVPLKIPTTGITYDDLTEEEKERFDLTDWNDRADDVMTTRRVESQAVNNWLFNKDTVDKVLKHLMERGMKVDGGDKLGKTIIFAQNQDHADFIKKRFDINYPKTLGDFASTITFKVEYAQSLIDKFSIKNKDPQIAISVDMLDTGIDVPEVVNLVFFKQVRSKTKFWQMVGRGTRLCPDLFGPGEDKKCFYIFDYCGNLEYFKQEMAGTDGSSGNSISKRLFTLRLKLLRELGHTEAGSNAIKEHIRKFDEPETEEEVFKSIVELLKSEVDAMNTSNFIVRAKRKLVEKYQDSVAWVQLDDTKLNELETEIAGLPTEKKAEMVEAKMFDLLMLRLQISRLKGTGGYLKMKQQVMDIAASLTGTSAAAIPNVKEQLTLLNEIQEDSWWEDVTVPMLEVVRLRVRNLVQFAEKRKGSPVYTDFEDEMGEETIVELPGLKGQVSFERFREKARAYLLKHQASDALQKLRLNEPLSETDLDELSRILAESGTGDETLIAKAAEGGLGIFVRSLVGLDREAAKAALGEFIASQTASSNQIEFINMIIDYLTEHGVIEPRVLYESPFTDINPKGPDGVFDDAMVDRLLSTLKSIRESAVV